jgi:hypothetical protein
LAQGDRKKATTAAMDSKTVGKKEEESCTFMPYVENIPTSINAYIFPSSPINTAWLEYFCSIAAVRIRRYASA